LFYDGDSSASAGDLLLGFTSPSGATLTWCLGGFPTSASSTVSQMKMPAESTGSTDAIGTVGISTKLVAYIKGVLRTSSTSGAFTLKWSQNQTSTNATTIYTDSFMELRRVA
jgi:hypothetical protein